jgi:predicted amidohydrolase YtcJ
LTVSVTEALQHGFQVCTHAIGDRANSIVLNVYERAINATGARDHRLRVEHAQVLHPDDIGRFAKLRVLPSMQPTHCTSDMYWAEARLGHRRSKGAYAWRSLLSTGVIIPCGSDFPVEYPNPLLGVYAAITRRDAEGKPRSAADLTSERFELSDAGIVDPSVFDGGWYAGERMTLAEVLKGYTTWAATAAFEESQKGSLTAGKLADFIVLSDAFDERTPQRILDTKVESTYIGGRRVYAKP